jgi:hypothetical protein
MNGIDVIARQGIALIENPALRQALDAAYCTPQGVYAAKVARHVFDGLTAVGVPHDRICRFLAGWHATHGTSQFVSGLMIRMLRSAEEATEPGRLILYRAAGLIGEIIPEDTGVDDTPHNELFARFANSLVGDDRWRLDRYQVPGCERFRAYVKNQRLHAPIDEAILTTAVSENWNSGEYTYFNAVAGPWITHVLGQPAVGLEDRVAYVAVHAGETELGHFLHAMDAWQRYCQASGCKAEPEKAKEIFTQYLTRIRAAFEALAEVLASCDG